MTIKVRLKKVPKKKPSVGINDILSTGRDKCHLFVLVGINDGQSQEKWRAEGGGRRAEGRHWADHKGL